MAVRIVFPARAAAVPSLVFALCAGLAGCRSGRFPQYPSDYREYAYVADAGSNRIVVLDLVHVREQTTLLVPPRPVALAVNPRRNEIYVVSEGSEPADRGALAVVDAETNRTVATLALGRGSSAIALAPDGSRAYVANTASNNVSVVDVAARRVLGVVGVGEAPDALAVSADNATLVVANRGGGSASVLSAGGGALPRLRQAFGGCPGAGAIALLPDASKAFVACAAGHRVMVLGLQRSHARRPARLPVTAEPDRLLTMLDVGQNPAWLARKPDGGEIFVENAGSDSISEIDTGTNEVGGATLIGAHPQYGVVSADNALLWVANEAADTVAVYSVDDGQLINTVHVGGGPSALAFSADGHLLLAADARSGDISVIRTFSRNLRHEAVYGTLFTLLPAGNRPSAIADKAFRVRR